MQISKKRLNEIIAEELSALIKEVRNDLISAYERDPGSAYGRTSEEIHTLIDAFGEDDVLIDALMKAEGQSDDARAQMLGVDLADLEYERDAKHLSSHDMKIPVSKHLNVAYGGNHRRQIFKDY